MTSSLHSLRTLQGRVVKAMNEELGEIYNSYIDERTWRVSYFILQTGGWFRDRRVLISPSALQTPFWSDEIVWVNVSRQEILESPSIDTAKPVSRQQEELMNAHFGWPAYWGLSALAPPEREPVEPSSLRSMRELAGYAVVGTNGQAGTLTDFICKEPGWEVAYAVAETGGIRSKKRFVPTRLISGIDWAQRSVHVSAGRECVANSPNPLSLEFPDLAFAREAEAYYASATISMHRTE